jgi:hypothetical protein
MQKTGIWDIKEASKEHKHSPRLAKGIESILPKNTPVNDFGCGKGSYIAYLQSKGYTCTGYEGTPDIESISDFHPILPIDLSNPFVVTKANTICLEVAEHIPKDFEDIFVENLASNTDKVLILSWGVKGQGGHGHVNEQNKDYVVKLFTDKGFTYNVPYTVKLRNEGGKELWWFKNSIYVFTRK